MTHEPPESDSPELYLAFWRIFWMAVVGTIATLVLWPTFQ